MIQYCSVKYLSHKYKDQLVISVFIDEFDIP